VYNGRGLFAQLCRSSFDKIPTTKKSTFLSMFYIQLALNNTIDKISTKTFYLLSMFYIQLTFNNTIDKIPTTKIYLFINVLHSVNIK
jgi:hypothetical protein